MSIAAGFEEIIDQSVVDALAARAQYMGADAVMGTDLITVEIGGQDQDVILTQEGARYLHSKLADLIGLSCGDDQ